MPDIVDIELEETYEEIVICYTAESNKQKDQYINEQIVDDKSDYTSEKRQEVLKCEIPSDINSQEDKVPANKNCNNVVCQKEDIVSVYFVPIEDTDSEDDSQRASQSQMPGATLNKNRHEDLKCAISTNKNKQEGKNTTNKKIQEDMKFQILSNENNQEGKKHTNKISNNEICQKEDTDSKDILPIKESQDTLNSEATQSNLKYKNDFIFSKDNSQKVSKSQMPGSTTSNPDSDKPKLIIKKDNTYKIHICQIHKIHICICIVVGLFLLILVSLSYVFVPVLYSDKHEYFNVNNTTSLMNHTWNTQFGNVTNTTSLIDHPWSSRFWDIDFTTFFNASFTQTNSTLLINAWVQSITLIRETFWLSNQNSVDTIMAYMISQHSGDVKTLKQRSSCGSIIGQRRESSDSQCNSVQQAINGDILLTCFRHCKGLYLSAKKYANGIYRAFLIHRALLTDVYSHGKYIYTFEANQPYCRINRYSYNTNSSMIRPNNRWVLSDTIILDQMYKIGSTGYRLIVCISGRCGDDDICKEIQFFISSKSHKAVYRYSVSGKLLQQYGGKDVMGLGQLLTPSLRAIDRESCLLISDSNGFKILDPMTGIWSNAGLTEFKGDEMHMVLDINLTATSMWIAKRGPKSITTIIQQYIKRNAENDTIDSAWKGKDVRDTL